LNTEESVSHFRRGGALQHQVGDLPPEPAGPGGDRQGQPRAGRPAGRQLAPGAGRRPRWWQFGSAPD